MSGQNAARAILGAGLVSLDLWDTVTQKYLGFDAPVDADKFEIKPNFEEKTSISKSHLDYGQARASVVVPQPTELTIEIAASTVKAMAMQFQGVVQQLTQAEGTVEDEAHSAVQLGQEIQLAKVNIKDVGLVVKKDATPIAPENIEVVSYARGIIKIKSGITNGDNVTVSYGYNALDGSRILGGLNPQIRCRARFDGKNMVDGSPLLVDVHEAVLGASNGFDFLASDFAPIVLTGKIVTPAGKQSGYEVRK